MAVKIALIKLLQAYDFRAVDNGELEFDNFAVTLQVKGGIRLQVTERQRGTPNTQ